MRGAGEKRAYLPQRREDDADLSAHDGGVEERIDLAVAHLQVVARADGGP